jgi:dTDP-glucose 4,6-dehydratase
LPTKRVLVTGGAGFIAANFIHHLLRATPYEVVSLDALTYAGNPANLTEVMAHERLSFVHGDIRDVELVTTLPSQIIKHRMRLLVGSSWALTDVRPA